MEIYGPGWNEAQQAWKRLRKAGAAGLEPLQVLGDVGVMRRVLDVAELAAVRAARRAGRSWAEIATNLGVTRQSAWEKWRELDDTEPEAVIDVAAAELVDELSAPGPDQVVVPDVVGFSVDEARRVLRRSELLAAAHNPGHAPLPELPADGTVVDQVPKAGARRRPGSVITLWIERGGGSAGVREPRRPKPDPREGVVEPRPAP